MGTYSTSYLEVLAFSLDAREQGRTYANLTSTLIVWDQGQGNSKRKANRCGQLTCVQVSKLISLDLGMGQRANA